MADTPQRPAEKESWIMRAYRNPVVGMIATLATILSIFLSIYLYVLGTKKRDLVYFVNPAQAVVVKTGQATQLHVLFDDRELKSDVTAAQVAIWNGGNESIRSENVLDLVKLRTSPSVPILEASIRKKSRDLTGILLDPSEFNAGVVGIKWKILEQNDGAVLQIVYAGPPNTEIITAGTIEGQLQIRELRAPDPASLLTRFMDPWPFSRRVAAVVCIVTGVAFAVLFLTKLRELMNRSKVVALVSWIVILLFVGMGIFQLALFKPLGPPFAY